MAKILVTGGPVHTKLDAVKIITNRFKGGRMKALALALAVRGHDVIYLGSKYDEPARAENGLPLTNVGHDGFTDYMDIVTHVSAGVDMVVLGAAVANLVPEPPWDVNQKFPSHDYEEGDLVNVPFRVAPRVINLVKEANPRCTLIGFKLLSGVSDDELVRAAYTIVRDSGAALVVANDAKDLDRQLLVTREQSVRERRSHLLANTLNRMARDEHYATVWRAEGVPGIPDAMDRYFRVVGEHREAIEKYGTVGNQVFGCVAVKVEGGGFLCSPRGKNTVHEDPVYVHKVHHRIRHVLVGKTIYLDNESPPKASLNAPLLHNIFKSDPRVWGIVHTHQTGTGLLTLPYAPPGTIRDSQRDVPTEDFEIRSHGTFTHLREES